MSHIHNALHHFNPEQQALRGAVGEAQADFPGVERAGETLTPILDIFSRYEFDVLRGKVRFSRGNLTSPAVAARYAGFEIVNPAGSGILAEITYLTFSASTHLATPDSGGSVLANAVANGGIALDTRWPRIGEGSVVKIYYGDAAASTVNFPMASNMASLITTDAMTVILQPGWKIISLYQTVNTAYNLTRCTWWERRAKPGEL